MCSLLFGVVWQLQQTAIHPMSVVYMVNTDTADANLQIYATDTSRGIDSSDLNNNPIIEWNENFCLLEVDKIDKPEKTFQCSLLVNKTLNILYNTVIVPCLAYCIEEWGDASKTSTRLIFIWQKEP